MTHTSRTIYFVMAAWMIVGSTIRIAWFVQHGIQIDAIPIITILLALTALAHAFRPHRPAPPVE